MHYIRNHRRHQPRKVYVDQEELKRRKLVRRSHFMGIVAAWVITVPCAAGLAALIFFAAELMR
jgi:PiT family inorganic phosphate transporter